MNLHRSDRENYQSKYKFSSTLFYAVLTEKTNNLNNHLILWNYELVFHNDFLVGYHKHIRFFHQTLLCNITHLPITLRKTAKKIEKLKMEREEPMFRADLSLNLSRVWS